MGSGHHRHDCPVQGARTSPVAAWALLAASGLAAAPALAQGHPDAGAQPSGAGASERRPGAPVLKSIPNANNVLSEGVRARLAERAAARHPSELAARAPAAAEPRPNEAAVAAQSARQAAPSEPVRRGLAYQRRVMALETGDGITVLSNRVTEPPPPRSAALGRTREAPELAGVQPEQQANDESSVTETRSLRASSSRREVPQARQRSLGSGWLVWPFVLLLATGAVVGTLWFSKKT
jgi:hypothetical protein